MISLARPHHTLHCEPQIIIWVKFQEKNGFKGKYYMRNNKIWKTLWWKMCYFPPKFGKFETLNIDRPVIFSAWHERRARILRQCLLKIKENEFRIFPDPAHARIYDCGSFNNISLITKVRNFAWRACFRLQLTYMKRID